MGHFYHITFLAALVLLGVVNGRRLPHFVDYCHQSDPDINECVKKALEQVRPHLAMGIPEFGLPPMAPLKLSGSMDEGPIKVKFENISVYHFNDVLFDDVTVDLASNHIEIEARFPYLEATLNYSLDGTLLLFTFDSKGPAYAKITNTTIFFGFDGKRHNKHGKEFMVWDKDMELEFNIEKADVRFENLFEGDQELTDRVNKMFNDNFQQLVKELTPVANKILKNLISTTFNRIFDRYAIKELFPK